jgi:hypothetical protein
MLTARYKLKDIFCQAWLSHAVSAVARQGIPDVIPEKGSMSAERIANACKLDAPTVYRVMRALAANGIFEEVKPREFSHNEVSRLLRSEQNSYRGLALMWNHPSCVQAWMNFGACLADGRSGIEHAFGKTLYEHLGDNPAGTEAFSDAMISNSALVAKALAAQMPFDKFNSVLDLGGGVGTFLLAVLDAHPQLRGSVYEIRDLEQGAKQTLGNRAEVIIGSFLERVPPDFDLYMVKNSMWNWNDDNCLTIMQNVRGAIGNALNKRFAIIEYVIDESNTPWSTLYDLQILNMPGGRARTQDEYKQLLADAHFAIDDVMHVEDQTIILAKPLAE